MDYKNEMRKFIFEVGNMGSAFFDFEFLNFEFPIFETLKRITIKKTQNENGK